jgi:Protein of unknown function, DUF485
VTDQRQDGPPARVRVTASRSDVRRRPQMVAQEIDDQTELGVVYVRSLLWSQLRLSAGILIALFVVVGCLPLAFTIAPGLMGHHALGMPLTWVLLGFVVYPVLLLLGWIYVRRAERHERSFSDLVDR